MNITKEPAKLEAKRKVRQDEPIKAPKVPKPTVKTNPNIANSEFEKIRQKREQLLSQEKIRQRQLRQEVLIERKNRRLMQIIAAVTLAVLLFFAPIYPNKELNVNDLKYLQMADINVTDELGNYFSPFEFIRYYTQVKNGNEYIDTVDMTYDMKNMTVNLVIDEYNPLAKDVENKVYFYENDEVIVRDNLNIYAPILVGFDQNNLEKVLASMQSLDYSIIVQIDTIAYAGTEENPELLKLGMVDGNTVYINMEQIHKKMPYYNQINQIIDDKATSKPGIIHLDLGDYYEPK
ncbi:hypothetical protein RZE82_05775 [Mollicutes bacterium LVI A0039]|nr:hypothetical protein RZE82_05775 [Mollicutes bacterium LVI A0039]